MLTSTCLCTLMKHKPLRFGFCFMTIVETGAQSMALRIVFFMNLEKEPFLHFSLVCFFSCKKKIDHIVNSIMDFNLFKSCL